MCTENLLPSPALRFPIRCCETEVMRVYEEGNLWFIEEMELSRAFYTAYDGKVCVYKY
jgi:hypothetical protein